MKRFGQSPSPGDADDAAWTCALGPAALPDLRPAVEASRLAVRARPKDANMRNTLGAVLYRAGEDVEAVKELNESIRLNGAGGSPVDFLFLAMACQRLGKPDEAASWLERAEQAKGKQAPAVFWVERQEWELLHREDATLVKNSKRDPKQ